MVFMKCYGSKELVKCLLKLGFKPNNQNATSHQKYSAPDSCKIYLGDRNFVMVQTNRREFDPQARTRYIAEIKRLGFSESEILKCLK